MWGIVYVVNVVAKFQVYERAGDRHFEIDFLYS